MTATNAKQERLPGTENKIEELHDKAQEYAARRDERMVILEEETAIKAELLDLMKKHGIEKYDYGNVHCEIVHDNERVKVRIKKDEEENKE